MLIDYARANEMEDEDVSALRNMFWKIWAHPDLIGFPLVAESLRDILRLADQVWEVPLEQFGMERWPYLSEWLEGNWHPILAKVEIDEGAEQIKLKKNPMMQHGVELYAIYSALCQSHEHQDWKEKYRLLQGHLLFAFSLSLADNSSLDIYEQVARAEPLPNTCYSAALALRGLSKDDPGLTFLLGALELKLAPREFAEWIETFKFDPGDIVSDKALKDLDSIRRFLVRTHRNRWIVVTQPPGGTRRRTWRDSVHGHVEFGAWGSVFHLPPDPITLSEGESRYVINSLTDEEREQHRNSTDDSEGDREVSVKHRRKPDSLTKSPWKQNNQKMMSNQLLPFDRDELNGAELAPLWAGLREWWHDVKPMDEHSDLSGEKLTILETGALLWVMLWTVSSVERARRLIINTSKENRSALSLSIFQDEKGKEVKNWRIKTLPPKTKTNYIQNSRLPTDFVLLPDVESGSAWVQAFSRRRQSRSKILFEKTPKQYLELIQDLFKKFHVSARVTADRYSKVLFWRILRLSGHDITAVSLITCQDHWLDGTRMSYTTRRLADLQQLYVRCAQNLVGEIASACGTGSVQIEFPDRKNEAHLGVRHCPTLATVRTAVTTLRERLRQTPQLQLPTDEEERRAFAGNHDDLTLYTYWMFAFSSGIRGIVSPYPRKETIDDETGICSIDDKKSNSGDAGYRQRLVWLPPVVKQQMQAYKVYLDELKRKSTIESEEPCFFLNLQGDKLRPATICPAELKLRMQKNLLPFPANTQRAFLQSELLGRGCSPQVVDALLGHWFFGEEPWAPYSTFNYAIYFEALEHYICPLFKDMGFEVVRKRIVI